MKPLAWRTPTLAWAALVALLALTAGSSLLPLGVFNLVSNFAIATAKAGIVVVVFMRVQRGGAAQWLAAAAGVVWLALLTSLALVDFIARGY